MSYAQGSAAMAGTFAAVSNYVGATRGGLRAAFSAEDRVKAMVEDDEDTATTGKVTKTLIQK